MKLRVCLIIPTLDQGGAEKQLSLLARGLLRHDIEPIVIALTRGGPREPELIESGVQVHHVNKRFKYDPLAWLRLRGLLRELKPDVVHTWLFAANAYGRSAALAVGVPIIMGSERSVDPWKNGLQFWIDRYLAKRTHGLTANSQGTIDFYAKHGVSSTNFHLIPNGIEPQKPSQLSREEAYARMGVPLDCNIILSVGRLWPQKGYKDLIWSAHLLHGASSNLRYIIIGDGPERQRLEQYRDNVLAAEFVQFLGERTDVSALLPHVTILWNGSHYEGQSNVILEAMQAGVPVVASDIPGNRELIEHEKTGLLFPLGEIDPLTRTTNHLLRDAELRNMLANNARIVVQQKHSLQNLISLHADLYRAKVAGL